MFDIESLDIPPLTGAHGTVHLPGSKSISNRVLLLAALSQGQTVVHDLLASDDTAVMLAALKQMGCSVEQDGQTAVIGGLGGQLVNAQGKLFMGNAGTAMRPLTAALALLGGDYELSGVPRMHERPIGDLVDALRQLGCSIDYLGNEGFPPLHLKPGKLALNKPIAVRGDVSSQFLTALLMALPLVAKQDIRLEVTGELISKPYIEITLNLLARFGIQVRREGWQSFTIPSGSRYQSPGEIHVEGDASSASYFVALGAIATGAGHSIDIRGIGSASIQGDIRFVEAAQLMGAKVESNPNSLKVSRGAWPLKATVFLMGVSNGAFSIAAIGSMMSLATQGRESREGVRMGLWGAAQAVAFGLGGLVGAGASDLARWWFGAPGVAYSAVFAFEAALFVLAAWLALRAAGDGSSVPSDPSTAHEASHRGATLVSTPRLAVRDPQAGDAPVAIIKSS
jgi:3-phosphoshikimate 1-carboxyvinyltransferase